MWRGRAQWNLILKSVSKLFKCQQLVCGRQGWQWLGRLELSQLPSPQQATPCLMLACPPSQSLVLHMKKEGEECSQERKERWEMEGQREGEAGSMVALSCLWARSAPWLPSCLAHPPHSVCLLPLISLSFLGKVLAEKIFMNSWACRRCWGCLKPASLTAVCMGSAPDKALGSGRAYTIGWVFMRGPPVWRPLLGLLIGTLWSAVYLPFIIQTQAEAAGKIKRLSNAQVPSLLSAPTT